jgi:hypothetical protein
MHIYWNRLVHVISLIKNGLKDSRESLFIIETCSSSSLLQLSIHNHPNWSICTFINTIDLKLVYSIQTSFDSSVFSRVRIKIGFLYEITRSRNLRETTSKDESSEAGQRNMISQRISLEKNAVNVSSMIGCKSVTEWVPKNLIDVL